jgi:hypothetical protein
MESATAKISASKSRVCCISRASTFAEFDQLAKEILDLLATLQTSGMRS